MWVAAGAPQAGHRAGHVTRRCDPIKGMTWLAGRSRWSSRNRWRARLSAISSPGRYRDPELGPAERDLGGRIIGRCTRAADWPDARLPTTDSAPLALRRRRLWSPAWPPPSTEPLQPCATRPARRSHIRRGCRCHVRGPNSAVLDCAAIARASESEPDSGEPRPGFIRADHSGGEAAR